MPCLGLDNGANVPLNFVTSRFEAQHLLINDFAIKHICLMVLVHYDQDSACWSVLKLKCESVSSCSHSDLLLTIILSVVAALVLILVVVLAVVCVVIR